ILDRYPDAMMVQTHRDPQKVIPSLASLYANMRSISTEDLQPERIGQQILETWSAYLEEGIRRRSSRPDAAEQILDIQYPELVADPIGTVRRVYHHFDLPLEDSVVTRMRAHLASNPRHRYGVHRYDQKSYGLEPAAIESAFKRYCDHFGVEREQQEKATSSL
ncbi:MAG: sulfotransferase, partial [Deltaproteobacteria bacterium]|nr:sulfotransferase [Deltaproteobacteria bacterium]